MFDRTAFYLIAGGDANLGHQVADLFRADCLELLENMEAAILRSDDQDIRRLGHTLKSTCQTVGAHGVSQWGKEIEEAGLQVRTEILAGLKPLLEEVFSCLDAAADALQPVEN